MTLLSLPLNRTIKGIIIQSFNLSVCLSVCLSMCITKKTIHQIWVMFSYRVGFKHDSVLLKDVSGQDQDQFSRNFFLICTDILYLHTKGDSQEDLFRSERTRKVCSGVIMCKPVNRGRNEKTI